ncbi:hypothetical protein Esti_002803 [Eimeria stiedai]
MSSRRRGPSDSLPGPLEGPAVTASGEATSKQQLSCWEWRAGTENGGYVGEQRACFLFLISANRAGLQTLWCWSNVYLGWKVAQARGRALPQDKQAAYWEQRHEHFANLVWDNIKELKGWWVKVGQFLSTRSDLLPQQYIHHLIKLQDMMPTTPYEVIKKRLEAELGDLDQIFSKIEEKALASASVGQVHRAWLKDGSAVVIKVQHADVENLLMHDMANLKQLSWAFGMLEPGMNFVPILEEWQKAAGKELDFRFEFAHQQRAYDAAQRSQIGVVIPKCYPDLVTKSVFVMEYIDGFKVTDTAKLDQYGIDRRELMYQLCDSFAYQIHIDGLFNGDPHPGNILVSVNPETKEAKPVILDWGLVKEFDSKGQTAFSKLVYSVASMDVMGLMEAFEDMGFQFKEAKGAIVDPEIYMGALRLAFRKGEGDKEETEVTNTFAGETVQAAIKAGIDRKKIQEANPLEDWPKDIIFFVRVASLLHGLCVQLDVHIPFLQIMVRRAQQCLFNRYQPPSPLIYTHFLGGRGFAKCSLQQRLNRLLRKLVQEKLILGCQVAVCFEGEIIVDAAIGQMGPVDTRPVTQDALFCGYCTTKGLLSTALLQLVNSGELELDDAVSSWWDGFIRYGKRAVTVQQLLTHRAGLHRAMPADLTLSRLADYGEMVRIVEDAPPACPPGELGRYAYLTYGWAVSELVRSVSGVSIDSFIHERLLEPLGLEQEIFLRLPDEPEEHNLQPPSSQTGADQRQSSRALQVHQTPVPRRPHSTGFRRRSSSSSVRVTSASSSQNISAGPNLRHSSLTRQRGGASPHATPRDLVPNSSVQGEASATNGETPTLKVSLFPQGDRAAHEEGTSGLQQNQEHADTSRPFLLLDSPCSAETESVGQLGPRDRQVGLISPSSDRREGEKDSRGSYPTRLPQTSLNATENTSARTRSSSGGYLGRSMSTKYESNTALSSSLDTGDDPAAVLSRGSGDFVERKLQLSAFPKHAEIVQAETPIRWRLTSARRKISFSPMTQQEVLQGLEQAKGKLESTQTRGSERHMSADDAQTRRNIATAMRQRRRRLHNMRASSGPVDVRADHHPNTARSLESLLDGFSYPKTRGAAREELYRSEEEGCQSPSDCDTEEPGMAESDFERSRKKPAAPGSSVRVSVLELIQKKPHVMDPLIYDSHRIMRKLIPPTNCRCTARALARLYSALGDGRIISKPLLDAARVAHTTDPSLEALLLTGGGSRTWGLGYQLYDCAFLSSPGSYSSRGGQATPAMGGALYTRLSNSGGDIGSRRSRRVKRDSVFGNTSPGSGSRFAPQVDAEALLRDRGVSSSHPWGATLGLKPRGVVGLGHGDAGGSVALCFPELNLSITILLNDVLTGPEASQIILEFLLKCFGLQPKWQTQVSLGEVLENLTPLPQRVDCCYCFVGMGAATRVAMRSGSLKATWSM